ncbi:hypothetical protein SY89_03084 [Halolamina pelagica]|uniref:Protein-glutamine gamma-glutamyltransferase-like C-terminal domain-containing protein n=1 Tax=Halolamina pelagica TaxID=699431 RepID=A0A0P7HF33_9EURY|nr:DUF4129 domain-containing protein [Halolamina pelagica]KPN32316.1 hypothetical protein SY89_03084 [Halolamina pelagica]
MRASAPRRLLIATVALLCVLQAVAGAGVVAGASTASATELAQMTPTPTNNTTVQQENPDDVDESGDTEALESYLAQSLAERLGDSAIRISESEYEQGRSILGDEYDSTLEKYVDVAGETDDSGADSFDQAAESQRELAGTAETYNETYQEYQEARANGNDTRARELARDLNRLATDANASARQLADAYTRIENATGVDLSAAEQEAMSVAEEVSEQHETVMAETFVETRLSVQTSADTVSFADPATVEGRLTLENGSALRNETVRIRIGEQVETVETDSDGRFTVTYRPVTIENGTDAVSVAYLPASESPYLGSNATLDTTIVQTTATLTVDSESARTSFGDNVTVAGRAHVDGVAVEGARVRVTVDEITLGTVTTGANGSYDLTSSLPASVESGDQSVEAVIVPTDSAVGSGVASTPLTVETTSTTLSLNVTGTSTERVRLTGELTTAEGAPIAGQTVDLRIAGTTVAAVETRADGTFSATVTPQAELTGTVPVRALYDAPSSNLAGATARAALDLAQLGARSTTANETNTGTGTDSSVVENDAWPLSVELLGGGGVAVLSVLAIGWLVRRGETSTDEESPAPAASPPTASSTDEGGTDRVAKATALLDEGDSAAAIQAFYGAVRRSLSTGDDSQTHWEFYATASDRLQPERAGALERLTEAYEQVVYSPDGVATEDAAAVVADAASLLGDDDESAS